MNYICRHLSSAFVLLSCFYPIIEKLSWQVGRAKKFILTESVFSSLLISFMSLFTISYSIADQLEKQ